VGLANSIKFIVRLQAEITVKSRSLRQRHGTLLTRNVRHLMKDISELTKVRWLWDKVEVDAPADPAIAAAVRRQLGNIPGIAHIEEVLQTSWNNFEATLEFVLQHTAERLRNASFAVRVKRKGKHEFSSQDLAAYIGGGILARVEGTQVQLKAPQQQVQLWLEDETVSLLVERHPGLGGYPLPAQETVLSLISGGFDSAVASYQMIRRGARTHFCFFNLGGAEAHEAAVREIAYFIWQKYSATHPVKFISLDFSEVVERILAQDEPGVMGVVLKRAMLRAGALVAERLNAQALVTGEAMGQVSSQTLSNLKIIDEVTPALVLRPLISMDKQQIVDIARSMGVEAMSAAVPEYCGVISQKPTVKAKRPVVYKAETGITDALIEAVVVAAPVRDIREVQATTFANSGPQIVQDITQLPASAKVIDIRTLDEQEESPLVLETLGVMPVPFFKLASFMAKQDPAEHYVLYCQQGVMSRLQAIRLQEEGFAHVYVFQPRTK